MKNSNTTRRSMLAMIGVAPLVLPSRSPIEMAPPTIPRVRATDDDGRRLIDLAASLESMGSEEGRLFAEGDRLNDLAWEAHGNTEAGWGCHAEDRTTCPGCESPEFRRLGDEYFEFEKRGRALATEREAIYQELRGAVLELLERAGIEPPGDLPSTFAAEARVRAIVEAGERTFLLVGSPEFEWSHEGRDGWDDGWGYPSVAIL